MLICEFCAQRNFHYPKHMIPVVDWGQWPILYSHTVVSTRAYQDYVIIYVGTHLWKNLDKDTKVLGATKPNGLYASINVEEDPSKPEMEISCVQARGSTIERGNDEYICSWLSYRAS